MIDLQKKSAELRKKLFEISLINGGHVSTSFSCMDILVGLYYSGMLKYDVLDPNWVDRDRFILSKGHAETALYVILSDLGYFPEQWMKMRYRTGDCFLGGHPDIKIPGVEATTGSLGHGLGIGAGLSLGGKLSKKPHRQFVLLGDAECSEGSIWEAALFASKNQLSNLIAIVDRNSIGALDFTEKFTSLEPFCEKWESFGWDVHETDGHDFNQLLAAYSKAYNTNSSSPSIIIANTIKGKGIKFMENDPIWHTKKISTPKEITDALNDLNYE